MKPGDDLVYKCPKCGGLLKNRSLMSGNTFHAKLYSDAKQIAPMLPSYPNLTKCKKCDAIFWLSDFKKIGICSWQGNDSQEWKNAPYVEFLNINDLFRALNENKGRELYIRQMIWWAFNDRVRNNESIFIDSEDKLLWEENCNTLLNLFNKKDTDQQVMIAELYRNLEQFDKCTEIINNLSSEFDWLKSKFLNECKNKNSLVFQIR
jgi:uncharacterized C2H2 Zn-finger protein